MDLNTTMGLLLRLITSHVTISRHDTEDLTMHTSWLVYPREAGATRRRLGKLVHACRARAKGECIRTSGKLSHTTQIIKIILCLKNNPHHWWLRKSPRGRAPSKTSASENFDTSILKFWKWKKPMTEKEIRQEEQRIANLDEYLSWIILPTRQKITKGLKFDKMKVWF